MTRMELKPTERSTIIYSGSVALLRPSQSAERGAFAKINSYASASDGAQLHAVDESIVGENVRVDDQLVARRLSVAAHEHGDRVRNRFVRVRFQFEQVPLD